MSRIKDRVLMRMWRDKFSRRFKTPCRKPGIALIAHGMEQGGVEQVIMDLYHGYKKRGYRAYIVCQNWVIDAVKDKLEAPEDIYVFNNDIFDLVQFLWRRDVRTLHYHYNVFGMEIFHKFGFRIIYTMHNVYTWMGDEYIRGYAEHLRHADYVVPVAESVRKYFCARTGYAEQNLKVINNGVNFADLDLEEENPPVTRETLGFDRNDTVIGIIGSFYHAKHQIGMLGVAEKLIDQYPGVKIAFLGGKGDINYYRRFTAELNACKAKDSIRVVPFFNHRYVGTYLRQVVDIFALPSIHEGNPLTALEAMYCGKPMVLTPTGLSEELAENAACLVADAAYENLLTTTDEEIKETLSLEKHARNENSLVKCFSEMIDHLEEYKQKAEKCRENAKIFSVERMVDEYISLI